MNNIFNFFRENKTVNPPYDYYFLKNLDEKEYPRYLAKLFYLNTGEKLPLKFDFKNKSWIIDKKRCKTFNQKIQWIKLYGVTDLMRKCTDKVAVRDYIAEKIGSEYLKPVLQVIPSLYCDCHVIARNNSTLGDEAIQGKRSQKAVYENSEMKSNNQPDCHVAIAPRNDETITDINTLSHSEPDVNSGVKNLYNSSRVDFSQPKQDVTTYFDQINFDKLPNSSRVDFSLPKQDVTTYYNQIDWEKLPNAFVIKCNHGCKWQYIIKDKKAFLQNKRLFDIVKRNMTGWLQQDYSFFGGFEMQYKTAKLNHNVIASKSISFQDLRGNPADLKEQNKSQSDCHVKQNAVVPRNDKYIEPKILIEPFLRDYINDISRIEIYCFNGQTKIIKKIFNDYPNKVSIFDENFNNINYKFDKKEYVVKDVIDDYINQMIDLSKELSQNINFVRIDWMIFNNRIYFEEMTFTPMSGYLKFPNKKINKLLGDLINN